MKTILSLAFAFSCLFANAQSQDSIKTIVDKAIQEKNLTVDIYQVFSNLLDKSLDAGYVFSLKDSIAKADLPFFGTSDSPVYGQTGGIRFNGPVTDYKVVIHKKRYAINFSVKNTDGIDFYDVYLDIDFDGYTYMHINSAYRSWIAYSGMVRGTDN